MFTAGFGSCGCDGGMGDAATAVPVAACPKPPWLAITLGALGLGLIAYVFSRLGEGPRALRADYTGRVLDVVEGDETTRLPVETMADVVWGRR